MEEEKKSNICRVCLCYDVGKNPGKGLKLFDMYNGFVISDQINALTNVEIAQGDGLPDMICSVCLFELENAFKFKQKCEKTNEILLSAVNNATAEETNELEPHDPNLPVKEEYLDEETDDNLDDIDDHLTLAEIELTGVDAIKPELLTPRPSKAIDLKLECNECGGSFKSKCKLRVHWKRVHLAENLKCPNCLRKFKSVAALKSHHKRNLKSCATAGSVRIEGEGRNRVFHCKDCNYKSLRIKDVTSHITIHTGERPYICDVCHKGFTQQSSLASHQESVHKLYLAEGTCQYCGKHIQGRNKLYRHMKQHRYTNLPCTLCSSVLKTKESLRNHMRRHSGIKSFSCEVCPTSFFTASELSNHKTKVHLKSRVYRCEICNYTTAGYGLMARHKPKHSATNVACNICGIFLDNDQQMSMHKKRHTDRHFQCPHCDKAYYSRKNLGAHIRKKHRLVKLSGPLLTPNVNSVKSECSIEIDIPSSLVKVS